MASLAEAARTAARQGDWERVEILTREMLDKSEGNAWVGESVHALRALAVSRNTEAFSKEARYKSSRMRYRMMEPGEDAAQWSFESEAMKPSYMRKKGEEGRRFGGDDDSGKFQP